MQKNFNFITGTAKQMNVLKNTLARLLRVSALWIIQYRQEQRLYFFFHDAAAKLYCYAKVNKCIFISYERKFLFTNFYRVFFI